MMDTPRILSVQTYHPPRPGKTFEAMAGLTISLGPLLFKGARLVRFPDGMIRLHLPGHGQGARVVVTERALREALLDAALAAVRAAVLPLATAEPSKAVDDEHP
jgi:hypothetical protein